MNQSLSNAHLAAQLERIAWSENLRGLIEPELIFLKEAAQRLRSAGEAANLLGEANAWVEHGTVAHQKILAALQKLSAT